MTGGCFDFERIQLRLLGFSMPNLSFSSPLILLLCSHFYHFSSLPFPFVLLLQCSVSLLLGWPLPKPWARSAALLTLTLGLPVAKRASGKFSFAQSAGIKSQIHVCVYGVLTNSFLLAPSLALQT